MNAPELEENQVGESGLTAVPGGVAFGRATVTLPATITAAGEAACRRFIEVFTAEIRNEKARRAHGFAVVRFTAWCERQELPLERLEPVMVAAYVEELMRELAPPSVKQHLAAVRRMFDYLVTGGVLRSNPAASVREPKHVVRRGKTPVLTEEETRALWCLQPRPSSQRLGGTCPSSFRVRQTKAAVVPDSFLQRWPFSWGPIAFRISEHRVLP